MNDRATLVSSEVESSFDSCLKHYFQTQRLKNSKRMVGALANSESDLFEQDVRNLTNQLEDFVQGDKAEVAYLVLGKVQSGKTANMVGSIAWGADSNIALVAAFTGVTEALNDQTFDRFSKDLSSNSSFVSIHSVPTSPKGSQYKELKETVFQYVEWRTNETGRGKGFSPLPVLITLKNKHRVQTLKHLFEEISLKFGSDTTVMLIDDEADQASQNSMANKGDIAATYKAISELRDVNLRNILLSYTATPQAVLLTDKYGRLRPDFCVTIKPRDGYFGLEDAVSDSYQVNRIVIDDGTDSTTVSAIPLTLRNAILEFFWTAWIRSRNPKVFYSKTDLSETQLDLRMKSTQMLIHESSRVANHEAMYKLVSGECQSLTKILGEYLNGNLPESSCDDLRSKLTLALSNICDRLEISNMELAPSALTNEGVRELLSLLIENRILIVNGDKDRSTAEYKIPVSDEDWEHRRTWILIGGDILGRGLTIPQLTTTYFLRQAKKPNFDTVSQQMRFCGYRNDYLSSTTIHAPQSTLSLFRYMNQIDSIVWERACKWDKQRLDIGKELPAVMYASLPDAPIAPTRKSVRDPNLVDRSIGEYIFSLWDIFSPQYFRANVGLIQRWIEETREDSSKHEDFLKFSHVQPRNLQRLLASWSGSTHETRQLRAGAELYDLDGEHLGLSDYPTTIFIDEKLLNVPSIGESSNEWVVNIETTRSVQKDFANSNFKDWTKNFETSLPTAHTWPSLRVAHVGDGQRKFKKSLPYDSAVLLIEPILGLNESRKRETKAAAGIGITFFAPENFEVRIVGHS
jgi:hypothetical protein